MVNELERCPTRSENVYFANNEQASIADCNRSIEASAVFLTLLLF